MPSPKRSVNHSITKPHPLPRMRGKIRLHQYRRGPNSPIWEASFKTEKGWSYWSTGCKDETEAAYASADELTKREGGVPTAGALRKVSGKSFNDAAELAIKDQTEERELAIARGTVKDGHKFYQRILRMKTLQKYLGTIAVADFSKNNITEFMDQYRVTDKKTGKKKKPAQNTVGNLSEALSLIVQQAVKRQWIKDGDGLTISRKGYDKPVKGTTFTRVEMQMLHDFMSDGWVANGVQYKTRDGRRLIRGYVAIGACTGIRAGNELEKLRVGQVVYEPDSATEAEHYRIAVFKTKTHKDREVAVFQGDVWNTWKIIKELTEGRKTTELLFARPSGVMINYIKQVPKAIAEADLRINRQGQSRTAYSLRHYYATESLLRGTDIRDVAREMGTSVEMIELHYDNVIQRVKHSELSGALVKRQRIIDAARAMTEEDEKDPF